MYFKDYMKVLQDIVNYNVFITFLYLSIIYFSTNKT